MERTSWRKSSRSSNSGDQNCVEARRSGGVFQVRDSKLGNDSPIFDLQPGDYLSALRAAQR
jgi:hypothetical protein